MGCVRPVRLSFQVSDEACIPVWASTWKLLVTGLDRLDDVLEPFVASRQDRVFMGV